MLSTIVWKGICNIYIKQGKVDTLDLCPHQRNRDGDERYMLEECTQHKNEDPWFLLPSFELGQGFVCFQNALHIIITCGTSWPCRSSCRKHGEGIAPTWTLGEECVTQKYHGGRLSKDERARLVRMSMNSWSFSTLGGRRDHKEDTLLGDPKYPQLWYKY
jgi:hypothetical protein